MTLPFELINEISKITPHLCSLSPGGKDHIVDLYHAGGIGAVMKILLEQGLVQGDCITSAPAKALKKIIKGITVKDADVIRPCNDPYHKEGGLAVLFGNIAPEGCVVKQSAGEI